MTRKKPHMKKNPLVKIALAFLVLVACPGRVLATDYVDIKFHLEIVFNEEYPGEVRIELGDLSFNVAGDGSGGAVNTGIKSARLSIT